MKKLSLTLIALLSINVAAAGIRDRMARLQIGMSSRKATHLLGRPDSVRQEGEFTIWGYSHRIIDRWSWDRADFYVVLKNDFVTEYGTGEIRQDTSHQSAAIVTVPFPH